MLGGGLLAIVAGSRLPPTPVRRRSRPSWSAWVWLALAGAVALWELQAYLQHPRREHPTISSLTNDLLQGHLLRCVALLLWLAAAAHLARLKQSVPARAVILASWLWLGWHIFVRRS